MAKNIKTTLDSFLNEDSKADKDLWWRKKFTVDELYKIFVSINADCPRQDKRPLTDAEYYADQIQILFGMSDDDSAKLADGIAARVIEDMNNHVTDKFGLPVKTNTDEHGK